MQDTAKPLGYHSGIYDIVLYDNSNLLYLGGITEEITVRKSATAILKGGVINYISSYQIVDSPHITLECQPGWSWLYDSPDVIGGITGLWADDTAFAIDFIDKEYLGYDPVWMNININIVPEPAALLLFGLGGLLLRRKRYACKSILPKKSGRKSALLILLMSLCATISFAGYEDDGFLTEGEYESMAEVFFDDTLIVKGGGANLIYMWGNSRLEVLYTSTPLSSNSGIQEIRTCAYSRLDYHGGITDAILLRDSSTAYLYGGQINSLESWQSGDGEHIYIYCQPGWSWLYDSPDVIGGITGLWADDTAFAIDFIDKEYLGYDPVWKNINFVIVPEPATLLLFGLGGLLLRRKR